jgi:enhancing lycopene biosynthesis protein 2
VFNMTGITWHIIEVPTPDLTSKIPTVLGWMMNVLDRLGPSGAVMMAPYKAWIEMVEGMDFTQEEYEQTSRYLMEAHAIARGDIYEMATRTTPVNELGIEDGGPYTVSRKEADIRALLHSYHHALKTQAKA